MLKKYIKIILILLIFNLALGGVICFLSGNHTTVNYSNILFIMGAIYGGLGPITLLGSFRSKSSMKERRIGSLIGDNDTLEDSQGLKPKEVNFKYMVLACLVGILTIILSALVLYIG
ncbi:MAG: hypothetical protein GX895_13120 [Clostridiales bacterium]|uniref:hypothetical protein n=1 Tax=Clostridium sp. N3C TaxID=1776758 RepID=UPI00092DF854|nr:hypothetical protein [Clostridium sp. N3C]NLZ49691.1 hypothetical protein [Clostridiales bacterium]SCN25976.1 hypothetical protein N3C_2613 [Clostridium sp. N3C]